MASQFGTQFKTSAEILAEMQSQARAQQQATIQSNISRAQTPDEIAGTGIGNFLGTLGVKAFEKHFPSAPTPAQQNAQALGGILGQVNQVGQPQPQQRGGGVSQSGGVAPPQQPQQQLPQSQIFALQAQRLQSEMANASPENQQIMSQMQTNLLGEATKARKEEDRIAGLEATKQAGAFATKSANVNANNLVNRGYNDIADAVIGGMDVKDAMVEADRGDKAKVLREKKEPTKANKFITHKDGSVSVFDNSGNLVKEIADPQAAAKDKQRNNALMAKLAQTDAVMDNLGDMRRLATDEGAAGAAFSTLQHVPNTDSFRLANKIQTVKASLTFDQLQEMRDLSEDGSSGLGQVAVVEINLLGAKLASLDPAAGEEAFEEQLQDIEKHYSNIRNISLGKPATVNWDDPAYADNVKTINKKRYFKDANGQWHEV